MTTQTQEKTPMPSDATPDANPFRDFLDEVSLVSSTLKSTDDVDRNDPRLQLLADKLEDIGLGIGAGLMELSTEKFEVDRRMRKVLTELVRRVNIADPEKRDEDMYEVAKNGVKSFMGSIGVQAAAPGQKEVTLQAQDPEEEPAPQVDEAILASLQATEDQMAEKKYPTDTIVKTLAHQFLTISYPAQAEKDKGASGQHKVNLIGITNAYAHTFGRSIMHCPEKMRPKMWSDVKTNIINTLILNTGRSIDYNQEKGVPEIEHFQSMLKGVQLEVEALVELSKYNTGVRASEMDEDVREGFDMAFMIENGQEVYLDTKSTGSFNKSVNENKVRHIEDGVGIKKSRSGKYIIVIDVQSRGHNGKHSNKFELDNPQDFRQAVAAGVKALSSSV